uniref:uncharacterized protein LOC105351607 isoform X2 n=1 Tax=Fragaria vesca subsp. vesca TaxID=101020 RepID=UPI0005CAC203|nr:PREDICTED: uncharacterized protein LOC105351607 isoform X2 [Fragaria vesca subsp. vesca]
MDLNWNTYLADYKEATTREPIVTSEQRENVKDNTCRPCKVSVVKLKIPSATETDETAVKIEAYTKVLEESFCSKGTTIVAFIGLDAIYIASDSFVVSGRQDNINHILEGNHQKIYELNKRVVVTMAGNADVCADLLYTVQREVESVDNIYVVKAACERYIEEWKMKEREENKEDEFNSTIGLFSWEGQQPVGVFVGLRNVIVTEFGSVMSCGSGSRWALEYMKSQTWRDDFTKLEIARLLRQSVTLSSLHCPSTGGRVLVLALSRRGDKEVLAQDNHVITCLGDYYQQHKEFRSLEMKIDLSKMVLLVVRNLEYTVENENKVKSQICEQLTDIRDAHVIGVAKVSRFERFEGRFKGCLGKFGKVTMMVWILDFTNIIAAHKACKKHIQIPDGSTSYSARR